MKKISIILSGICLMFAIMFCSTNVNAATPVQKWGQLSVSGTNIVNKNGKKIQLKGISTHGIAWFPQYVNKDAFKSMKKMGANTVRLALYSDQGAGYNKSWHSKVEEGIKAATDLGMYVIVDWHILGDGNPKTNQKNAKKFFKYFAKKYGKQKNILYEICNEPNGDVQWKRDIKPYAKKIVSLIRKYDKKNIIIVGTPTWSQDVDVVAQSPLKGKNLVYSLHFYAATHKEDLQNKFKNAYNMGLPVLVSEFSICDASGNGSLDKKSASKWMKLLRKYKIGYVAWSLCNKAESASFIKPSCSKTGNFKKSNLTTTGKWIVGQWKK